MKRAAAVDVAGDHVGILAGSTIDASGKAGGGTIKVGGDFHGEGDTPTASRTIVQSDTSLKANATDNGDGGHVTVWADDHTDFAGTIEARGGAERRQRRLRRNLRQADAERQRNGRCLGLAWHTAALGFSILTTSRFPPAATPMNPATPTSPAPTTAQWLTSPASRPTSTPATTVIITTGSGGTNFQAGDITVANSISKTAGGNATLTLSAYREHNNKQRRHHQRLFRSCPECRAGFRHRRHQRPDQIGRQHYQYGGDI